MNNYRRGFTIIELLVVIAIIAVLASIVLVNVNGFRIKAKDVGALATGTQVAKMIQICAMDGGKVTNPNCANDGTWCTANPTNNICNLGAGYGVWPENPQGWQWYVGVWVNGEENLIYARSTYSGQYNLMHCGYYPTWDAGYYCGTCHVGICRGATTFTCTRHNATTGCWE